MCWTSATSTRSATHTSSAWTKAEAEENHRIESPNSNAASLALAGAATALTAPSPSAAAPRAGSSIVGGGPADPGQWPFAVAIFRKKRLHCGGSVIAPTKVLTAAHCVDGFNLSNFQVIAGRPNLRNGSAGQAVLVASGRVHPDFQQTALHDIAVLNLAQPTTVTPVALATPAENSAIAVPGTSLRVAGYGAVNPFGVRLTRVEEHLRDRPHGSALP